MSTATLSPPRPRPPRHRAAPPTAAADRPPWVRPALFVLLVGTAVLYLWNLSASGYANEYYAAAVQAGTQSLKAWLFGSLDSGNAITVDKPPAALWVMTASARLFGFSSWSLLAAAGADGRRLGRDCSTGPCAAGRARSPGWSRAPRWRSPRRQCSCSGSTTRTRCSPCCSSPVVMRWSERSTRRRCARRRGGWSPRARPWASASSRRWGRRCSSCPRSGWCTSWRVRPACAPGSCSSAPRSARWSSPRAGTSRWWSCGPPPTGRTSAAPPPTPCWSSRWATTGSAGSSAGAATAGGGPGGSANTAFGGSAGITRLFTGEIALEVSWLLPAALVLLVAGLAVTLRAPRTDRLRAALVLWGGWTLVTGVVFSFMSGTMHPYYTVALAPGIAALVGIGAVAFWRLRAGFVARGTLALAAAVDRGVGVRAARGLGRGVRVGAVGRSRRGRGGRGWPARRAGGAAGRAGRRRSPRWWSGWRRPPPTP